MLTDKPALGFFVEKIFNHEVAFKHLEAIVLRLKSFFSNAIDSLKSAIERNSLIVKATTLAFFIILVLSIIVSIIVLSFVPELSDQISSFTQSAFDLGDLPDPFTESFFSFIFLNNSGHFWNPIRMLVWIPLLGPLLLGFEILLNSGVIGVVAVMAGINNGIAYPIIGLMPHGIIEIPAFMLQFSSIVLWQVTITEAIVSKLQGRALDKPKIKLGLQDTLILAVTSIILLLIAAAIESYVTPYLLGL